jgi:hypothetical protein
MNRLLAAAALAAFFVAMLVIVLSSSRGHDMPETTLASQTKSRPVTSKATTTKAPPSVRVKLSGVGAYDPDGDGHENDELAPLAVDDNASTLWKTERYRSFRKTGVGLVLDAGKPRPVNRVLVSTDSAGASAEIEVGSKPHGPFHRVTAVKPLNGTTRFKLAARTKGRYIVVWVTALPTTAPEAHITEVRAFGPKK